MENTNEMKIIFDSRPENEGLARVAAAAFCTQLNPTLEEVADLKTAVSEAVTNCIIHAYEGQVQKIEIFCRREGQKLWVDVIDKGVGIRDVAYEKDDREVGMDHTLALIMKSQQGDKEARDTVFKENAGLVYSMAKRFAGRSVEMEDIVQIGSIGLLKAIDRFDISYDVKFSTYAVPMIIGEIRRYLRDDGMLKVSRNLKENCARIYSAREALEKELGREPILEEVAKATELSVDEVVMSMESGAEVESLHKIIYQGDGNDISLMDRLQEKENGQDAALDRIFLDEILKKLDVKERQLIGMRYFKDMTQTEIAAEMGISQVQVSRMEKRILKELKKQI